MNQKLLGALRGIGVLLFFTVSTALIGAIPDVLTQLPFIGGLVTPALATAATALAFAYEHKLADQWGYNLPVGAVKVDSAQATALGIN